MSRARGTLARLEVLEGQAKLRFDQIEEEKVQQGARAAERLSVADRETVREMYRVRHEDRAWWEEVMQAGDAVGGAQFSAGEAAREWALRTETGMPGEVFVPAPTGAVEYFEWEAAQCETALAFYLAPPDEYQVPEGVRLLALQTAVRWSASWWRWMADLAGVLEDQA